MTNWIIRYTTHDGHAHEIELPDHDATQAWLSDAYKGDFQSVRVTPPYDDPPRRKTWRDRVSQDDLAVAVIVLLTVVGIFLIQA